MHSSGYGSDTKGPILLSKKQLAKLITTTHTLEREPLSPLTTHRSPHCNHAQLASYLPAIYLPEFLESLGVLLKQVPHMDLILLAFLHVIFQSFVFWDTCKGYTSHGCSLGPRVCRIRTVQLASQPLLAFAELNRKLIFVGVALSVVPSCTLTLGLHLDLGVWPNG